MTVVPRDKVTEVFVAKAVLLKPSAFSAVIVLTTRRGQQTPVAKAKKNPPGLKPVGWIRTQGQGVSAQMRSIKFRSYRPRLCSRRSDQS